MKNWLAPAALTIGLVAVAGPAVAAAPTPNDPTPFPLHCPGFDVIAQVSGKSKLTNLPGNRQIITAPNERVTLTGPTGKTVNYVITGATHVQTLPNGNQEIVSTGRNILIVPNANGHPEGLFLTTGRATYTLDANGQEVGGIFNSTGTVTDVCALLAP
jgi:hypothetical protein